MNTTRLAKLLGLGSLPLAVNLALAQTAPPDAGSLLNQQQRQERLQPPADDAAPLLQQPLPEAQDGAFSARVDRVRFTGADAAIDTQALQAVVADALGKSLTHAQLQALAQRVSAALQAQGYLLARAYLPSQDLSDGELEIAIMIGRLQNAPGRVQVLSDNAALRARTTAIADAALPDGPVRNDQLERALLLINDVPGVSARATLEKGAEPGSSRLLIRTEDAPAWTGGVGMDNFSNRYTGRWRSSAWVAVNRPFEREDLLGMNLSHSSGSDVLGLNYSMGLTPSGLRANFAASSMHYEIGAEFKPLDLRGSARTYSAGLSYPLLRTRKRSLWISMDAERRELTDKALGQVLRERNLDRLTTLLSGSAWDGWWGGGYFGASLGWVTGRVDLDNAADRIADGLSARTRGDYNKLIWRVERNQSLGGLSNWGLYLGANGQFANKNLDSSEKLLLGGPSGVRGHAVGEGSGDEGWLVNAELRRDFVIASQVRAQALLFADHGHVRQHVDPWAGSVTPWSGNAYGLSSAGLGLNLQGERWSLRAAWAHRLGDNPGRSASGLNADGLRDDTYLWLQASLRF
ncbi:ShlB/FhaC/HecB family hemolysin secretion/activation protein [Pseudoxanthomonas winnipegensis]|uniref:ShlB/FhaC/HecB family hemolysin secretion/activation protein n=1 Tax=Pseudoxanthomonas winnipegensis TaxID=2480810 RepID=A0A4V2HCR1_9GAMM|nr:ShlB/FhaC/HecB family hemolysin secretion/activation protein [Pseudoxanthomonas winnipegensis]PZP61043.1 MAG: ShlB/FhaC/HecB family hemolysin secretion/activation protein [Pseudoxanthomonas spadix]TAA23260.1 ShlB/FhaC/HecB family hemolysin secretion/activation protein [Pseudoxanthomonas winnipegensis]